MYNECKQVLHAVGPLLERANAGIAHLGVPQVKVLSIEAQTSFLGDVLGLLKAGPIRAEDQVSVRSALQSGYLLKKYRFGGNPAEREAEAIRGYIARNSIVTAPSPEPYLKGLIQAEMRKLLKTALPFCRDWSPKFGNGAVAEKIPWIARWERIATHPELHHADILAVSLGLSLHGGESVRLCAVPKDHAKDRLITVEPWLGTFVQHATRRMVYESIHSGPLRGTAMDALHIAPEPIQKAYAVEGSAGGDYATLDLSDASDTISLADVEATFPLWLLPYLTSCRTPTYELADGTVGEINMYAGMGNATTFCVQTLYFWAACVSVARISGHRRPFVSVHGDDIVCDNKTVDLILSLGAFQALGIKMNSAKSYWGISSFRESCGIWALRGQDVTPSRFDGFDLGTYPGRIGFCDVIRRMVQSGCGMQLMLADQLVKRSSGVKVSSMDIPGSDIVPDKHKLWVSRHDKLETRWNKHSHYVEVKTHVATPITVEVPADRVGYLYGGLLNSVPTTARRRRMSPSELKSRVISRVLTPGYLDLPDLWKLPYGFDHERSRYPGRLVDALNGYTHDWRSNGLIREHVVVIPLPGRDMEYKKRWVPIEVPMGATSPITGRPIQ